MGVEVNSPNVRRIISDYSLKMNPVQQAFHASDARIRGIFGGSGGGKTRAIATEALILALEYPNNLVVVARDVLADLKRTTKVTFLQEVMPPELLACKDIEWREGDHKLVIKPNKSEIHFMGLDEPGRVGSLNCGAWIIDESHLLGDPRYWYYAFQRQTRRHNVRRCGVFAGHPLGKTSWLYKQFFLNNDPDWAFFKISSKDNEKNLPEGFVDDLITSLADDPRYLRRYVYGDWEDFEGAVFSEFDEKRHIVDPFDIPPHWVRYRGMDYGLNEPTTCLWAAIDEDEHVYFYDEYGVRNTDIPMQVETILDRTGKDSIHTTLLDGRSAGVRQQTGSGLVTIQSQYIMAGLPVIPSATGKAADVEAGIMRMKTLLAKGKFSIFRPGFVGNRPMGCPNLIREMTSLVYQLPKEGQPPTDKFQGEDHYLDAARYIVGQHYGATVVVDDVFKVGSVPWLFLQEDKRMREAAMPSEWYE